MPESGVIRGYGNLRGRKSCEVRFSTSAQPVCVRVKLIDEEMYLAPRLSSSSSDFAAILLLSLRTK